VNIVRFIHIVATIWIVLGVTDYSSAKAWRGIVPLKSTRTDVERLLGKPTGNLFNYDLPDSTVAFRYSSCRCGEPCKNDGWSVDPDTVVLIRVDMKGVVRLSDLKLDLGNFEKLPGDYDVLGSARYWDEKEGFAIEGGAGYVSALIYTPEAKDEHLRCPPNSSKREKYKPDCVPITMHVECSSDVIRPNDAIECKVDVYDTLPTEPPSVRWKAPRGVSLDKDNTMSVKVKLAGTNRSTIPITVKVLSPNICIDEATFELHVAGPGQRSVHESSDSP
jgi:hypothetical protein